MPARGEDELRGRLLPHAGDARDVVRRVTLERLVVDHLVGPQAEPLVDPRDVVDDGVLDAGAPPQHGLYTAIVAGGIIALTGGSRTQEVRTAQQILQAMDIRPFLPQVTACPGCGRTTSTFFQQMAEDIQAWLRERMPEWRQAHPGVEELRVAVMGCVVNGPGESKHAHIGISLPGTFEEPKAPVYVDGERTVTLRRVGDVGLVAATYHIPSGGHEDLADARLTFANGCVAHLRASRASPAVSRRMHIWAPEGLVTADWALRRVTLMQPSDHVRRHGLHPGRLDPASRNRLREDLFSRHLQMLELDGGTVDQLTAELEHFLQCVRTGARPRVSGEDGRDAIAAAALILDKIHRHPWNGHPAGPRGPTDLPQPLGPLFKTFPEQAAA